MTATVKPLQRDILEQVIDASAEPVLVARVDRPDWPVVLASTAFGGLSGNKPVLDRPLADVVEQMIGRELALEVSETVRAGLDNTIPVELKKRDFLLVLKPLSAATGSPEKHYALYWRSAAATVTTDAEIQQALIKARRRVRDLSRDDPVTGLLTGTAFREVLAHDWAVAAREQSSLALASFTLDDFDAYVDVFGRHASDSCLRRVAQAIRRCLRRASDVASRITVDGTELLVVLSHAPSEGGVQEFADRLGVAVRDLGIHHPRSRVARFVTVTPRTALANPHRDATTAEKFLQQVLL